MKEYSTYDVTLRGRFRRPDTSAWEEDMADRKLKLYSRRAGVKLTWTVTSRRGQGSTWRFNPDPTISGPFEAAMTVDATGPKQALERAEAKLRRLVYYCGFCVEPKLTVYK